MKHILFLLTTLLFFNCKTASKKESQKLSKKAYLEQNRFDVNASKFEFPQKDFNIIGFGALHGSAKIEAVEMQLLKSLAKDGTIKYYLPEVDYSTAYFYNKYLQTGDTLLLKNLIIYNGFHVPQERTIEMYSKWKQLKKLNDNLSQKNKIKVIGLEWIMNYKFVAKHLSELITSKEFKPVQEIKEMVSIDTTYYARGDLSFAYKKMQNLVNDYKNNKEKYLAQVDNKIEFDFLIRNIRKSFQKRPERVKIMYENYLTLDSIYNLKGNPHFMRIGFSHLEKSREGKEGYPSIFTRLIENDIYEKTNVISVLGYYTDSEVVWDELYDDNDNYTGFTKEAGFGISDYEKEYFRGIQYLKDAKISDKTLFRLNKKGSPYYAKEPDLIDVIMSEEKSNSERVKGTSTLDYLDYAILMSNSKASSPIFEMDKN